MLKSNYLEYKSYIHKDNSLHIEGIQNFNVKQTLESGQCFRFTKTDCGTYIVVAKGKVIEIEQISDDYVILHNSTMEDFENIWIDYFDLNRNYGEIKEILKTHEHLSTAIDFGPGIRLLNQDPFEMIISFIISSNNRIPMIQKVIKNISEKFGTKVTYKNNDYYLFPTFDQIKDCKEEDFRDCSAGFRAKYIKNTIDYLEEFQNEFGSIYSFINDKTDDETHELLMKFQGVGAKVADCIMLFSMRKFSAFPVDVWVKRAMIHFYTAPDTTLPKIRVFGRNLFGEYAGFAQQYLFYYVRENNIVV